MVRAKTLLSALVLCASVLAGGCYDGGDYPSDFIVLSILPTNSQTNVSQNSQILIRFTTPPDHRTIDGTKQIILVDQSNTVIPVTFSYSGEYVTVTPMTPFGQSATYGVAVRPGVRSIYGNNIEVPFSCTFSTGSSVSTIPNFPPFTIGGGGGPPLTGTPGTFTSTAPMVYARARHRMVRLIDNKILCTGGENDGPLGRVLQSAEIFDPLLFQWTLSSSLGSGINGMHFKRYGHTMNLLKDGRVLITGGSDNHKILNVAEIYDPKNDIFSVVAARMQNHRVFHTSNMLDNGNIILIAGWENTRVANTASQSISGGSASYLVDTLEVFDVYAGTFTLTANSLIPSTVTNLQNQWWQPPVSAINAGRTYHTSSSIPDGSIMICGGYGEPWLPQAQTTNDAQIYVPDRYGSGVQGLMKHAGTNLSVPRVCHTATVIANGDAAGIVILAGGFTNAPYQGVLASADVFDYKEISTSGNWSGQTGCFTALAQQMSTQRHNHTASYIYGGMNQGGILFTGGAQHLGVQNLFFPPPDARLYPWLEPTGCGACRLTFSTDVFMPFGFGKHTTNPFKGVNVTGSISVTQDINGNNTDMRQIYAAGVYFHAAEPFTNGMVLITGGSWCPFCMQGPNAWSTYFTNVVNGLRVNGPSVIYNP